VATDSLGNAWVANYAPNSSSQYTVSEIAPGCDTNTVRRSSLCTGAGGNVVTFDQLAVPGLTSPQGIIVDAAQNVWVANFHAAQGAAGTTLVEIAGNNPQGTAGAPSAGTAISPAAGYGLDAAMVEPFSVAPDPSGNLWLADEGGDKVVMFFGLATPTATPIRPTPTAP
jgi:hypothetical protein